MVEYEKVPSRLCLLMQNIFELHEHTGSQLELRPAPSPSRRLWGVDDLGTSWTGMSLSYREIIKCQFIGLFRLSKKLLFWTYNIENLRYWKILIYFVFLSPKIPRTFRKFFRNSENSPKIRRKLQKFAENSLKRRSFLRPKYGIVSRKKTHIVSNEKKHIAQGWSWSDFSDFRMHKYSVL